MSDINLVIKEITSKRNLETNLSKYSNYMMSQYNALAYTKLSFNYYTLCDLLKESEYSYEPLLNLMKRLNTIIDKYILNQSVQDIEAGVLEIDSIRNEVIRIMNIVTCYADRFQLYEYIINRTEYRFDDEEYDETYYNNTLGKDIMNYIISEKENNTINMKISEIVGQIPVRITKEKFYEYLSMAFSLYKGAEEKTVEDFIYMISTSAGLYEPENFREEFEEFSSVLELLSKTDYKKADKDQFKKCQDMLRIAADRIVDLSDKYMLFEEAVNDAYTIILSNLYAEGSDEKKTDSAKAIISAANKAYNDEESADCDIDGAFVMLEGEQERLNEIIMASEYVLDDIFNEDMDICKSLMLDKIYNSLKLISKLQTSSIFVELGDDNMDRKIATEEYVESKRDSLIEEFAVLFKNNSQNMNRAVMAVVLSALPVFFNSIDEVTAYVDSSLFGCSDKAERKAVEEIIKTIIYA